MRGSVSMLPLAVLFILWGSAIVITLLKNNVLAKKISLVAVGLANIVSVFLAFYIKENASIWLVLGADPWNLSLFVGPLESFIACLFTGIGFFIVWASLSMIDHDVEEERITMYYALICAVIGLLCGTVFFDNLFNIFICIELSVFAAAAIVIIKNKQENIRAGLRYIVQSILGSGFLLMGVVVFFSLTGSLSLQGIHAGLAQRANIGNSLLYAFIFILVGVGIKSALFPFHTWLPGAHGTAPSPSSAVLSALVLKAYLIFFIKALYVVAGTTLVKRDPGLNYLLNVVLVMGTVAMLAGSIGALLQTDIKRMIAYSSVAQIGYIYMGIGLGSQLGLYAAIFHILAHAVTKSGLFLVAGSIIEQTHNRRIDQMAGLGYQMPITTALFTIGALSMVGIPVFIGFNSKWNFAIAIMDSKQFWALAVLAISSLLNAMYYLPIVVRAFFGDEAKEKAKNPVYLERPVKDLLPIIALAGMVLGFAIFTESIQAFIQMGVESIW